MNSDSAQDAVERRRSFLKWATHGLGALFGAILGIPAIAYLTDARNRAAPATDFKTVANFKELPVGVPQQFVLHNVRRDAWTLHPNDVIGRIWLIRRDQDKVEAFTTVCPHLGCSINFEDKAQLFVCPCHGGTFEISGHRKDLGAASNPAPRGMDRLECRRDPADADLVQVKYENFIQGRETPVPKT
jgi:menaquinol-cytochrome c reductase iron-sulfur subunit